MSDIVFNKHRWLERVMEDTRIKDAAKLFAFALMRGANASGYLWANQDHLERWIGHTSTGRTYAKVKVLTESGYIRVTKQPLSNGHFSNAYQLRLPTDVGSNTVNPLNTTKEPTEPPAESAPSAVEDFLRQESDGSLKDTRQPPSWAVDEETH